MNSQAGAKIPAVTLGREIKALNGSVDASARGFLERRAKPRIRQSFPITVCGTDTAGLAFDLILVLENISSGGLYLRMQPLMKPGDELNVVVQFSNGHQGAAAALLGRVLRVQPGIDGLNGIALAIQRYEFI